MVRDSTTKYINNNNKHDSNQKDVKGKIKYNRKKQNEYNLKKKKDKKQNKRKRKRTVEKY